MYALIRGWFVSRHSSLSRKLSRRNFLPDLDFPLVFFFENSCCHCMLKPTLSPIMGDELKSWLKSLGIDEGKDSFWLCCTFRVSLSNVGVWGFFIPFFTARESILFVVWDPRNGGGVEVGWRCCISQWFYPSDAIVNKISHLSRVIYPCRTPSLSESILKYVPLLLDEVRWANAYPFVIWP